MAFDPFKCGTVASFPEILAADVACSTSIDQTQKLAFVEVADAGVFDVEKIVDPAEWTPLVTDKSILLSPFISDVVITAGDFQEEANENNIDGIPQYMGNGFSMFEFNFKGAIPATIAKLDQLTALSSRVAGISSLYVYFLGRNSRITAKSTGVAIPIYNFAIKDLGSEGRNKPNVFAARFYLKEDWSKDIKTFNADFDPIATLANPAS
jgi:preprotein translocase subunit SecB